MKIPHDLLGYVQLQLSEHLARDSLHKQNTTLPHISSLRIDWHGLGFTDFRAMGQHFEILSAFLS